MKFSVMLISCQGGGQVDSRSWHEGVQGVALLRHRGFSVADALVRTSAQGDKAVAKVRKSRPTLVVLHCDNADAAPLTAKVLEGLAGLSISNSVVAVGHHVSLNPDTYLNQRALDALIPGRWQDIAGSVAGALEKKGSFADVPGVVRKEKGELRIPEPWDLTTLPGEWPAIGGAKLRGVEMAELLGGVLPIRASHGFPFRGLFHADTYLRHLIRQPAYYHKRPVSLLVEEAVRLRDLLNLVAFEFIDEIFPWDDKWIVEFASHWKREVHRPFAIASCAEFLQRQRLRVLADAGLQRVTLSLESGCETLRAQHSNLNATNALVGEVIANCQEVGVEVSLEVLLGVPGETEKSLKESGRLVKTLAPHEIRPRIFQGFGGGDPQWKAMVSGLSDKPLPPLPKPEKGCGKKARKTLKRLVEEGAALQGRYLAKGSDEKRGAHQIVAHLADSDFHSPWEDVPSHTVRWFHAPDGSKQVLAVRVPGQFSQMVDFPESAMLRFSIILEPRLSGERTHQLVSFAIKLEQGGKNIRLFHKVLIQALDPDSRRWHSFTLPISGIKPGLARLKLEVYLTQGASKGDLPPEGESILAGWADMVVSSRGDIAPNTPTGYQVSDARSTGTIRRERMEAAASDDPDVLPLRLVPAQSDRILFPETLVEDTEPPFGAAETPPPSEDDPIKSKPFHKAPEPEAEQPGKKSKG